MSDAPFICFEVRDGIRRIGFSVSDDALEAVAALTLPSTPALRRRSFDRFRTLIDAAAQMKLRALSPEARLAAIGPFVLTREDLRLAPHESGAPAYGSASRASH